MHEVAWALHHVLWSELQGTRLFHNRQVETNAHEDHTVVTVDRIRSFGPCTS